MSSTRKPHRRTMSLSAGSNDSSENLLSVPNQRIVNSTSNISNTYNSSQNSYLDSTSQKPKSSLSPINESSKSLLQSQPSTPSKNKSFVRQMSNTDPSSRIDLKNILQMLVFTCALVFFLGSLSGIGPPFDELDYPVKEPNQFKVEEIVQEPILNDIPDTSEEDNLLEKNIDESNINGDVESR
jgi:hypothetical protein